MARIRAHGRRTDTDWSDCWWVCGFVAGAVVLFFPAIVRCVGLSDKSVNDLAAGATLLGGVATAVAVFAAVWAYRQERNRHRASVLLDAFSKFYDDDNKRVIRAHLEAFGEPVLRAVARKAIDAPRRLTIEESELCSKLDDYLNFFQFIGWLYESGDIDGDSVRAMFRYFLDNLRDERNVWLLDYMQHFGYSPLIAFLRAWRSKDEPTAACEDGRANLFAYGTLRREGGVPEGRSILGGDGPIGRGSIQGALYQVEGESYPALKDSWTEDDVVVGELFTVTSDQLERLDEYEDHGKMPTDLFVRRMREIRLDDGTATSAWVYLWNGKSSVLTRIQSGDWVKYREGKTPARE